MISAKPAPTPLPLSHPLYEKRTPVSDDKNVFMETVPYRKVLGSLIYLCTRTRPDLATAVSMLGKFQAEPAVKHWKTLKNVVRYLIKSPDYGILLQNGTQKVTFEAWSDADWARDHCKRRSRSGYVLLVNDSPIIWSSRLQTWTALSTSEAEFTALSSCVRETKWLKDVLEELGAHLDKPTTVNQDSLGCISGTGEVQRLRKVKHVGMKYHHVKDAVAEKKVEVLYTPSVENRADSLTQASVGTPFSQSQNREWLGVYTKEEVDATGGGVST